MDAASNGDGPISIALGPMRQRTEVRSLEDDWTGVTSTADRRKLQNRLNQRAYRRRQIEAREPRRTTSSPLQLSPPIPITVVNKKDKAGDEAPARRVCTMGRPSKQTKFRRLTEQAIAEYVSGSLRPGRLPGLIQVNVFNALARNAAALRVSKDWLLCEAISPFNLHGPGLGSLAAALTSSPSCPDSLRPTALQLSIPHHPWIDLLPVAHLRDNILYATEISAVCDEDDLCYDMVEVSSESDKASLIVWGEPWDPRGWEISVAFLRKWGGLLKGCPEMLEATNYWRQKRGDTRLAFGER